MILCSFYGCWAFVCFSFVCFLICICFHWKNIYIEYILCRLEHAIKPQWSFLHKQNNLCPMENVIFVIIFVSWNYFIIFVSWNFIFRKSLFPAVFCIMESSKGVLRAGITYSMVYGYILRKISSVYFIMILKEIKFQVKEMILDDQF